MASHLGVRLTATPPPPGPRQPTAVSHRELIPDVSGRPPKTAPLKNLLFSAQGVHPRLLAPLSSSRTGLPAEWCRSCRVLRFNMFVCTLLVLWLCMSVFLVVCVCVGGVVGAHVCVSCVCRVCCECVCVCKRGLILKAFCMLHVTNLCVCVSRHFLSFLVPSFFLHFWRFFIFCFCHFHFQSSFVFVIFGFP